MSSFQEYHADRLTVSTEDGYIEQHEGSFIRANMIELETGAVDNPKTDYPSELNPFFSTGALTTSPLETKDSRIAPYGSMDPTVKVVDIPNSKGSLTNSHPANANIKTPLKYPRSSSLKNSIQKKSNRDKAIKKALSHTIQCHNCGTKKTPLWRRTPDRLYKLCNACGLYYRQYKKHRTVSNNPKPTPLPYLNMNDVQTSYLNIFESDLIEMPNKLDSGDTQKNNERSVSAFSSKSHVEGTMADIFDSVSSNSNEIMKPDNAFQQHSSKIVKDSFSLSGDMYTRGMENFDNSFAHNQGVSLSSMQYQYPEHMMMFPQNIDIISNQNAISNGTFDFRDLNMPKSNYNPMFNIDSNLLDINLKTEEIIKKFGVNVGFDPHCGQTSQIDNILHFYSNYASSNPVNSKQQSQIPESFEYGSIYTSQNPGFSVPTKESSTCNQIALNPHVSGFQNLPNYVNSKNNIVAPEASQFEHQSKKQYQRQPALGFTNSSTIKDKLKMLQSMTNSIEQGTSIPDQNGEFSKAYLKFPLSQKFSSDLFSSKSDYLYKDSGIYQLDSNINMNINPFPDSTL